MKYSGFTISESRVKRVVSPVGKGMVRVVTLRPRTKLLVRRTRLDDIDNFRRDMKRISADSYKILEYVK